MSDRNIVQELRFLGSIECPYGCDEVGNPAADAIEELAVEVERLRAAGDALTEAFEALRDEHDACWCPDPRTEMFGTCQLCAAEEGWQEARRER